MNTHWREADEWDIYQKWLGKGRLQAGIQEFLCFNGLDKGEDGDLDLNFCGKKPEDYYSGTSSSSSLEEEDSQLEENFSKEELWNESLIIWKVELELELLW